MSPAALAHGKYYALYILFLQSCHFTFLQSPGYFLYTGTHTRCDARSNVFVALGFQRSSL